MASFIKIIPKLDNISTSYFTSEQFYRDIPEFRELFSTVEHNAWHEHERVSEHSIAVFRKTRVLIKTANQNIQQYLQTINAEHTRYTILLVAALLHDIGKPETMARQSDGSFLCPGHEALGASKTMKILSRIGLHAEDNHRISEIILHHGLIHSAANPVSQTKIADLKRIQDKHPAIFIELLFLAYADTAVSGELRKNNSTEYRSRISFYRQQIESL